MKLADEPARSVARAEGRAILDRLEREAAYRTAILDLDWRAIDLGTAAHEMIHQLAADSGLLPRHDAFPYWLHEGFAAQFEVIRGGRWAGIGRAHDLRLIDWRNIQLPRADSSVWSATPASAVATSATFMPRPGHWSITCAPGAPAVPDVRRPAAQS